MIQWYPGHMAKAIREIDEKLKLVDLVIVLLDARIPYSSLNPLLQEKFKNKQILYVLTKKDMANVDETSKWLKYYQMKGYSSIAINSKDSKNIKLVVQKIEKIMLPKRKRDSLKGLKPRPIRAIITGIPNVGKSTFINALVNKKVTNVGDKPGVTKVQQWIRIHESLELLDTPGVLWPKFEDQEVGYRLAIIGSIKDDILKINDVAEYAIRFLQKYYFDEFQKRYLINELNMNELEILNHIGKNKKYFLGNGEIDLDKTSRMIIQDIRNLSLGKITFDILEEL